MAQFEYITKSGTKANLDATDANAALKALKGISDVDPSSGVAEVKTPTPESKPTTVAPETTANPVNTPKSEGFSASFLTDYSKGLEDLKKSSEDLTPKPVQTGTPEEKLTPEYIAKESNKGSIGAEFDRAKQEIQDIQDKGNLDRGRARELLGMTPAAIRYNVDKFVQDSTSFDNQISRSIERLTKDEETALANNDLTYANTLRQQKVDWYNMQRTNLQDKLTFMTTAYNTMLTGKQFARQEKIDTQTEANNGLNFMLQADKGQKFDALSPEEQTKITKYASDLGYPIDAVKQMLETPDVKFQVQTSTGLVLLDGKGNVIRNIKIPGMGTGTGGSSSPSAWFESVMRGDIGQTSVPADYKDNVNNMLNAVSNDPIGGLVLDLKKSITKGDMALTDGKYKGYSVWRNNKANEIVDRIYTQNGPGGVSKLLGVTGPLPQDALKNKVLSYIDAYAPEGYFNKAANGQLDMMTMLLQGMQSQ